MEIFVSLCVSLMFVGMHRRLHRFTFVLLLIYVF